MSRKSFYKQSSNMESLSTTTTFEVEKPTRFIQSSEDKSKPVIRKSRWLAWLFLTGSILILIGFGIVGGIGWWYWQQFEQASDVRLLPLVQTVWKNRSVNIFQNRNYKTFLLLGLDQSNMSSSRDNSMLTDTMILAYVDNEGRIKLVSLPRDLWIDSLKTKINALYFYGQQSNPGDGVTLLNSVITEMTGVPIDYNFVISMDTMKELVDAVGGIDIDVVHSFVDEEYPREIDLSSTDPAVLYQTIRFNAGLQHMDGATALQYIRSRHSKDTLEGSDEGREARQQVVLSTLKKALVKPEIIANPKSMGALYRVWKNSVKTNMQDVDLFLLAKKLSSKDLSVATQVIPVEDSSSSGLIYHPQQGPQKQWVYLPKDASWGAFHAWFAELLHN